MPSYAEFVSTAALLMSGGNLAWQVRKARSEQPIISVDGQWAVARHKHEVDWTEPYWCFPVHVTNSGGKALTVVKVYWELSNPSGPFQIWSSDASGTSLPTRLDALSAEEWEAQMPVAGTLWAGLTARPAADVVLGKGIGTVYGAPVTLSVPDAVTHVRR